MSRHSDDGYGFEQQAEEAQEPQEDQMVEAQAQLKPEVTAQVQQQEPKLYLLPTEPKQQTEPGETAQVQQNNAQVPDTDCGRELAFFKERAYRIIDENLDPSKSMSDLLEDAVKGDLDTNKLEKEANELAKLEVDRFAVKQACGGGKGK